MNKIKSHLDAFKSRGQRIGIKRIGTHLIDTTPTLGIH